MGQNCNRPSIRSEYKLIIVLPIFPPSSISSVNLKNHLNEKIKAEQINSRLNELSSREILVINKSEDVVEKSSENLLMAWEKNKLKNIFLNFSDSLNILANGLITSALIMKNVEDCYLEVNPGNIYIEKDGSIKIYMTLTKSIVRKNFAKINQKI